MKYKFEHNIKDKVFALDYAEPRVQHCGVVLRRWLEENPDYMEGCGLLERYTVLILVDGKLQSCEFLANDLTASTENKQSQ